MSDIGDWAMIDTRDKVTNTSNAGAEYGALPYAKQSERTVEALKSSNILVREP